jgi:DNA-binding HxlR family transcriptional regulator
VFHPVGKGPKNRIYNLLPEDGSRIQYKELRERAAKGSMGFDTLHRHLPELERDMLVLREVDSTTRPPTVWYRRAIDAFFPLGREFYEHVVLDREDRLGKILSIEDVRERDRQVVRYLVEQRYAIDAFLQRLLELASTGLVQPEKLEDEARYRGEQDPERILEFVDTAMEIHLFPWIERLASRLNPSTGRWREAWLEAFDFPLTLENIARLLGMKVNRFLKAEYAKREQQALMDVFQARPSIIGHERKAPSRGRR